MPPPGFILLRFLVSAKVAFVASISERIPPISFRMFEGPSISLRCGGIILFSLILRAPWLILFFVLFTANLQRYQISILLVDCNVSFQQQYRCFYLLYLLWQCLCGSVLRSRKVLLSLVVLANFLAYTSLN